MTFPALGQGLTALLRPRAQPQSLRHRRPRRLRWPHRATRSDAPPRFFNLGQSAEASIAFDALVMSNPLYEPRATDLTPEALAAFRTSQRQLLPGHRTTELRSRCGRARRGRRRSSTCPGQGHLRFSIGDCRTRRRSFANRSRTWLRRPAQQAAAANEVIYTGADAGVIPPRPLSRQLPVTGPIGVPPNRVGWLEIVVSRDGTVVLGQTPHATQSPPRANDRQPGEGVALPARD